jgi:hypothetical protein
MALVMNQRAWPGLHRQFEEIHTDMALTTNREYGLDPTAERHNLGLETGLTGSVYGLISCCIYRCLK